MKGQMTLSTAKRNFRKVWYPESCMKKELSGNRKLSVV